MTPAIVEGAYLLDILDQPAALDRTVDRVEVSASLRQLVARLRAGAFRRIVLTGMGSSLYALYPLQLQLVAAGWTSVWVDTAELIHYQAGLLSPDSLLVAVSQSGRSAEIVRLIEKNAGRAPIIGVTNTPDSPLGTGAAAVLLTHAGTESAVACKTYVTSLAVLQILHAVVADIDVEATRTTLGAAGPAVAAYLHDWRAHVAECAAIAGGTRCLFFAGRGPSLAAALTGGLITKESAHVPAEGMSPAAFRHGPIEMLGPHTLVVVFEGDEETRALNVGLYDDIRAPGHRALLVGTGAAPAALDLPVVGAPLRPMVEILPVQMLTLGLASLTGREAGHFTQTTKITARE